MLLEQHSVRFTGSVLCEVLKVTAGAILQLLLWSVETECVKGLRLAVVLLRTYLSRRVGAEGGIN